MREYFTYGSVRGAAGNGSPYRVHHSANQKWLCPIKPPSCGGVNCMESRQLLKPDLGPILRRLRLR